MSRKVADLEEFWKDQPYIDILDPNTLACSEWENILTQLAKSKARVNFNQGLDIRLMTEEKAKALSEIKLEKVHFALDRYQDIDIVIPRIEIFKQTNKCGKHFPVVYVLCGYDTTLEQDLERIYRLRELDCQPYVMLYEKYNIPKGSALRRLQRWVNSPYIFWSTSRFEEYK